MEVYECRFLQEVEGEADFSLLIDSGGFKTADSRALEVFLKGN